MRHDGLLLRVFRTERLLGEKDSVSGSPDGEEAWDRGVEGGRVARVREGVAESSCVLIESISSLARELKVESGRTSESPRTSAFGDMATCSWGLCVCSGLTGEDGAWLSGEESTSMWLVFESASELGESGCGGRVRLCQRGPVRIPDLELLCGSALEEARDGAGAAEVSRRLEVGSRDNARCLGWLD